MLYEDFFMNLCLSVSELDEEKNLNSTELLLN